MTTPKPDATLRERIEQLRDEIRGKRIVDMPDVFAALTGMLLASPPVPEPTPEPSELGTVVRDADGRVFVLGDTARDHSLWYLPDSDDWLDWMYLAQPVTVLHPGWSDAPSNTETER